MDMRGLAHFIQDVRKATSSPVEERKRVDLELAKIRSKFCDTATMSVYDRKKYVCKLMFIAMLGYPVEFGHMEGVKLLALPTAAEKLIGYLFVTVFLHENHPLLTLTTHMIHRDLMSEEELRVSLALTAIANAGGKEFAEVMSEGVKNIILNSGVDVHIRKKAVLTYLRVYRKYPEVADLTAVIPVVSDLVLSHQFGLCGCAVTFLAGCLTNENIHLFCSVTPKVIELIGKIILAKQTEPGYVYYGVPAPWLQASAVKLLRYLPVPTDPQLREKTIVILHKIVEATDRVLREALTQQKQKGTMNRVSAMNAVLVEVVSLVIKWNVDSKLRSVCLDVLNGYITEKKDSNLRYLGLSLLSRMCTLKVSDRDYRTHCRQYQPQIIVALHDPDVSIRTKALDVTVSMCDSENAKEVINELLSYLPIADGVFKENLVLAIAKLAETYCIDYGWYVDTIIAVIVQAGNLTPQEVVSRVVHVIINNSHVQKRAATSLFNALKGRKSVPDILMCVAAIILGEFGYQIALNAESTPSMQAHVIQNHLNDISELSQCVVLSTFVKFFNYYDVAVREKILKILRSYRHSFNPELQQRAMEYIGLIGVGNNELLQRVLEPIPSLPEDVFATKLNGTNPAALELNSNQPTSVNDSTKSKELRKGQSLSNGVVELEVPFLPSKTGERVENDAEMMALFHFTSREQVESMRREDDLMRGLFVSLLSNLSGLLYKDDNVEVQCVQLYRGADGRVTLTIRNKTTRELCHVLMEVISAEVGLMLQSRSHGDTLAPSGELMVEFAARSILPYQQYPSIRFCYDRAGDSKPVMKVLSLPITTTRFLSPYQETTESAYLALRNHLDTTKVLTHQLAVGSCPRRESMDAVLGTVGFSVVETAMNRNEWKAIAAHATQPQGVLLYNHVLVDIVISADGVVTSKVVAKDYLLQTAVLDALKQALSHINR